MWKTEDVKKTDSLSVQNANFGKTFNIKGYLKDCCLCLPEIEEFQLLLPYPCCKKSESFILKSQLEIIKEKQRYPMFKSRCEKKT